MHRSCFNALNMLLPCNTYGCLRVTTALVKLCIWNVATNYKHQASNKDHMIGNDITYAKCDWIV